MNLVEGDFTMRVACWCNRLLRPIRDLWAAEQGNVAIIFSIALIPLIALTGGAIDYTRASVKRTAIQAALDATALAMSRKAANLSAGDLKTQATAYFAAAYGKSDASSVTIDTSYSTSGGSHLTVTGTATVNTNFLGIIGINSIAIGSSATTNWGLSRLRVALVLDNTGSMLDSGKIGALKTATKSLLTQLQNAASSPEDVYVSIIPFVKDVNLGASNYTPQWENFIDWSLTIPRNSTPDSDVGPGSGCPYSNWNQGYTCVTRPGGNYSTSTIPSSGDNKGYICPSGSIGCYDSVATSTTSTKVVSTGWFASCNGYSNCSCTGSYSNKVCSQTTTQTSYTHKWFVNTSKWSGCVTDRGNSSGPSQDYDRLVTAPDPAIPASKYAAEQYDACPQPMMGLNNNWSAMSTLVDNMVANGSTNQPIGLVWGWQSLAGGGPFTVPALDSNHQYNQVIILLSDGLNTQDRWYGDGSHTSTDVDHRMLDTDGSGTCKNFKDASTEKVKNIIYTIQLNTGSDPQSNLLRNCATDTDKFFYLTSSDQISGVFTSIGTALAKLRITK